MKLSTRASELYRSIAGRRASHEEQVFADWGLFDSDWYLGRYPDVAAAGMDSLSHYMHWGAATGLDPNPLFNTLWYLKCNPDVAAAGQNPLAHYVRRGAAEGCDPNPLFDSDWYLDRNPDVAAAGMNPLNHYIRWGAAKGLDPSPLFSTRWYLERNPDVAAAGMNPLAHYIHWGAAELREPVSPVPGLFKKLAEKPRQCDAELKRILETYASPPDIAPARARLDNNKQVGVSWAEHFLFNGVENHKRGLLHNALKFAKYAMQTLPHEDDPIILYSNIFMDHNGAAIKAFTEQFSRATLLVVHITHQNGLSWAEQSRQSFYDPSGEIANLLVIGNEKLCEDSYLFDGATATLYVPARDEYEALPQKVAKALTFIGFCPLALSILKVDDETVCIDVVKLKKLLSGDLLLHQYGGFINPHISPATCSFWHFGKCADPALNSRPDGLIWTAPYAQGEAYWIDAASVNAIAKICLIHERHFEVELFEDRAVGTALVHYGVRPHHYDLMAAGVLRDIGRPLGSPKNISVRLRGAAGQALAGALEKPHIGLSAERLSGRSLMRQHDVLMQRHPNHTT